MVAKADLKKWVIDALNSKGGEASILYVARYIWDHHEGDLRGHDLFYSWQYDMRWAATELRKEGLMVLADDDRRGKWTLK